MKGSHRACRWLSSARWYPGPTAAAAPANGRTAACFRREVPGKVLPTGDCSGSSGNRRCGSGCPLREQVHGSDGTSLGHGLVADFGFWPPSFPVGSDSFTFHTSHKLVAHHKGNWYNIT